MMPKLLKIYESVRSYLKDPLLLNRWSEMDMYRYGVANRTNQLHKRIYGGFSQKPYYLRSDTHMLIEDIHTGVLPYLSLRRREAGTPAFVFEPEPDQAVRRLIIDGVSSRDRAFDITDACLEFIREATQQLMAFGVVHYELVYTIEDGNISSFSLESIPPAYFFRLFGNYYQVIPWWVAAKVHTKVGIIKIPANKVLKITFPRELGGRGKYMRRMSRLYALTKDLFPRFTIPAMEQKEETGFDSKEFTKNRYLEVARLTKEFGWTQRTRTNSYTTEYFFFKRYLDSEKARLVFREWILENLNNYLNTGLLSLGTHIRMERFITRAEITTWQTRMREGNLKFLDMFNDLKDR